MMQFLLICSLAALQYASVGALTIDLNDNKIVGGIMVPIEDFPHQVSLQASGRHFCGGSILDENYIITAGHCAPYLDSSRATVRAGSNVSYSGGTVHKIVWVKRHEKYRIQASGAPQYDIAVAKVTPPFSIDSTRSPIALYYAVEDIQEGQMSVISGYGREQEGGGSGETLMAVRVPIVSRKKCDQIYRELGVGGVTEDFICAGTEEGGKDSCQGDSGGPVVVKGQLAGIVSYGVGCGRPNIPGVYTNVAYFTKWIADNTP